jgi:hypothetical protein
MREYWNRYDREIADITSRAGICVELDHGLSQHRTPLDLLLVRDVVVRTTVSGYLIKAFNEQRALIGEFSNRDDAWFNEDLRNAIIKSGNEYGDLRSNHFLIPEWSYSQTDFFRTSAFGGIFVLRGLQKVKKILIHEDADIEAFDASKGTGVFYLREKNWLTMLLSEGVIKVDTDQPTKLREDVRRIKECLLAEAACAQDPECDFVSLNSSQRRGLVNRLGQGISETYFELERAELQLEDHEKFKARNLPVEVQHLLSQPNPNLPHDKRKVLCQLLSRYRPTDVWRLYRHNKHCFYEQYQTWTPSKQRWAISLIRNHLDSKLTD